MTKYVARHALREERDVRPRIDQSVDDKPLPRLGRSKQQGNNRTAEAVKHHGGEPHQSQSPDDDAVLR